MRVQLTPEAAVMLESRKRWWRENRPATADLFESEFLEAVALIREHPTLAPIAMRVRGREQRRILMKRTACHRAVAAGYWRRLVARAATSPPPVGPWRTGGRPRSGRVVTSARPNWQTRHVVVLGLASWCSAAATGGFDLPMGTFLDSIARQTCLRNEPDSARRQEALRV
jgi:hypothetical protein